jgi:hypothetical protein
MQQVAALRVSLARTIAAARTSAKPPATPLAIPTVTAVRRFGCVAAQNTVIAPPSENPMRCARSLATASSEKDEAREPAEPLEHPGPVRALPEHIEVRIRADGEQ